MKDLVKNSTPIMRENGLFVFNPPIIEDEQLDISALENPRDVPDSTDSKDLAKVFSLLIMIII